MNCTELSKIRQMVLTMGTILLISACLLSISTVGFCQDSYTMAPPIASSDDDSTAGTPDDSAASTVFNWQEVPANQKVPITRAVFDQEGYQLYDTMGETIIVKFKNDNLYVMKFAVSPDETTYFENSGTAPILYVPRDGYLENATVTGARWYPFTQDFEPSTPVFMGIAPSWPDYTSIGWYPDMYCYGGYWCGTSVGFFEPSFGLFISFGGHRFDGWDAYGSFCIGNPPPFFIGFYHQNYYHFASRAYWGGRTFRGYGSHAYAGRGFGGNGYAAGHQFSGSAAVGGRVFRGTEGGYGGHNFGGGVRSYPSHGGSTIGGTYHGAFGGAQVRSFGGASGGGYRGGFSDGGGSHAGDFGGGGMHGGGFGGGGMHGGGFGGGGGRHH